MSSTNRIIGGLALLATLILSLLPGGRAMRYFGPCGQSLCACPDPEPVKHSCCESKAPVRKLTLSEPSFTSLPAKLLSWSEDLTPTLAYVPVLGCDEELKHAELPDWHSSYGIPAFDIPHPPPRA